MSNRENTTDVDIIYGQRSDQVLTSDGQPRQDRQVTFPLFPSSSPLPSPRVLPNILPLAPLPGLDGPQQSVVGEDEMEEIIRIAIESVQDGSFDEHSARKFTGEIEPLLSMDHASVYESSDMERFSHLICARLNKLFVLERCMQIFHGLRFFYTALLLTGDVVVWMPADPEEGQMLILVDHQSIESFFWKKIFAKSQFTAYRYQELLNLLLELGVLVRNSHNENPSVCYHLAGILLTAYVKMRVGEKTFFDTTKDLVLTMAKCAWAKERYDIAGKKAREAAEMYFKYENAEAWELWSKCCHRQGDCKLAIQAAELAVNCAQRSDRQRLQQYLTSLRHETSQPTKPSSEINSEWLVGTDILHNTLETQHEKAKKIQEDHKKKKSRQKTKAVPKMSELPQVVSNDDATTITKTAFKTTQKTSIYGTDVEVFQNLSRETMARPVPARRYHEEVLIEVDLWEEDSHGSKEESDLSESEGSAEGWDSGDDVKGEEHDQDDEDDNIPTKTWFEESQDLYSDGKEEDRLIVGEGMDIVFYPSSKRKRRTPRYPPLQPLHVLEKLLNTESEKYKRCCIELDGPHRAVCRVSETGETNHRIEIHGRNKCGQTFNNDEVVVEIIDPGRNLMEEDTTKVFGKVVGVLSSTFSETEFPLLACTNNPKEVDVMHPMCKSVPKLYIWNGLTRKNFKNHKHRIDVYKIGYNRRLQFEEYFDILPNKREQYVFLVVYLTWDSNSTYPRGAVLKVLDCGSSINSGIQVLQNQFKVPTYYSKATVQHVEELLKREDKQARKGYINLTEQTVFTIDPPQAKDLDDALSITENGDHFMIGVHIADVASVVKKGDAVDKEAEKRATSFYPSSNWRAHHMLPEPLSHNRLSLLPNEERHVLSIFFKIDNTGESIEEPQVKKCVIKSCRQFSYKDVQLIIEKKNEVECCQLLKDSIQQLHHLAQIIRQKRLKDSRFAMQFEDPRFLDLGNILEAADAHALVEEFMIKANHFIASWLSAQTFIPLRCHAAPPQEVLDQLVEKEGQIMDMLIQLQGKTIQNRTIEAAKYCKNRNDQRTVYIPVQKNVWKQILKAAQQSDEETLQRLLCCDELHPLQCLAKSHFLNILQSAVYKCSADESDRDFTHFMLDIELYTHFTSPIRRYIDIVVHRLVHAVLDKKQSPYTVEDVKDICVRVTEAVKRQKRFDRGCRSIVQAIKLAGSPMVFDAVVDTVSTSGATLCIPALENLSPKNGEIAFNLLDFCCKPAEMENHDSHKTEVVGSWNKRIYSFVDLQTRRDRDSRQSHQRKKHPVEARVNTNMHIVHVQLSDFSKLLKTLFEKPSAAKEIATTLSVKGEKCYLTDDTGVHDVPSEICRDSQINHHSKFSLKFIHGQVLRVQMHAAAHHGVLSPYVQLFQVCNNLNLCLSHMHDPVNTYAKYVTTSIRDRTFKTVDDYQRAWLPVVEMDTVTTSVSSEQTVLIHDIKVELFPKGNIILGSFSFDTQFSDACKIEIDGKTIDRLRTMKSGESPYEKCQVRRSLDYLCIRYSPQNYQQGDGIFQESSVWIGHAIITKVKKRITSKSDADDNDEEGEVIVTFQLTSSSIPPPTTLISKKFAAVVEIIFKTEVDRRTQKMLALLDEDEDLLAKSIALKSSVSPLGYARLKRAQMSPTDICQSEIPEGSGIMPVNNANQNTAIKKALVERFSLIQGPPGTGKTYTGLKLVYLFNEINKSLHSDGSDTQQKQVLFCGPSNKSVDLVAKYLMIKLNSQRLKIVRMYGKTIEHKDFPVPKRDIISNRSLRGLKSDKDLRKITLHYIIRQEGKAYAEKIKAYDMMFERYFQNRNTNNGLNTEPTCATLPQVQITLADIKRYTRLVVKAEQEVLKICDVILCTCAAAGSRKMTRVARISQCIIDESAMCPEPQSMIPIIATKPDQVVLIGDHKQLRPIVQCTQAAELGLDQSLFERYKKKRSFLNIQYRMHPQICQFPSMEFYKGKLKTGPEEPENAKWYIPPGRELSIWPVRTNPKVFCHVEGVEETLTVSTEEGNEQSKSNMEEVEKIVDSFLYLVKTNKVEVKNINLMTQYNAQRNAVKERLKYMGCFEDVTIQTVVASQGGEWDYVIFSTVRSLPHYKIEREATPGWLKHNLGFITDQNQINVALTRAKKGLIIIGNGNLLNCDPIWRKLIKLYQDEGCYVNASQFPPPPPVGRKRKRRQLVAGNPGVLPHPV